MKLRVLERTVENRINIGEPFETNQVGLADAVNQVKDLYEAKLKDLGGFANAGKYYAKIALVDPEDLTTVRTVFTKRGPKKLY